MKVAGHGLSVDAPRGWEARIFRRGGAAAVLHVATFPLHPRDGDFGAAATGRMRPGDCFAALVEYRLAGGLRAGAGLFAPSHMGLPLSALDLHPRQLQVMRRGQLGCQRFYSAGGRALCMYAVLAGPGTGAVSLGQRLAALNRVLASVQVASSATPE